MHPSVSINTLCFPPAELGSHVDAVARLGARGISPDLEQIVQIGSATAAQLLRDASLSVATLTHRSFAFALPDEATAARARLERTLEIAAEIGAETVIMTTGGRGDMIWPDAVDRFAEAVAPCAERARTAELTPRYDVDCLRNILKRFVLAARRHNDVAAGDAGQAFVTRSLRPSSIFGCRLAPLPVMPSTREHSPTRK
ncbi:sugar phosphate isomerase/epimerase [Novosphingobium sp. G106]|uniref:sugar phosphate isomerase/epimerase family protein n=1 Tax=Novosphingobium sp. G106 TaxID=2849500 RepID=UPI001C2D4484|nr:TIM barrel protein [Novosphingobium sp. G106]MBV1687781.1 sugar phosphate isomerase/epimerase [Novosphingobium sp. G106]